MTGRAWRLLATATLLSVLAVLAPAGAAHLVLGGWPADVVTWAGMTALVFWLTPHVLVAADILMSPVQALINRRFRDSARRKLARIDPLVIGVTGSFGKTSTKFAIERLVGPPGTVLATPSSFNTPMGVVRTINESLEPRHGTFVVEMGARRERDIAELCDLVHPRIGVLTSIGPAHLETFGSIDAVRRTKYELVSSLPPDGVAIMNCDDQEVRALADMTEGVRVVRYGLDPAGRPDISASGVRSTARGTALEIVDNLSGETLQAETRLLGRHAVGHVLAAVAAARVAGRPLADLDAPIKGLAPVEHRLQLIEGTGGVTVIDDAYNSNPDGAAAALEVLGSIPARRRIVVTPGMIELGAAQAAANERFAAAAAEVADTIVAVAKVNRAALAAGAATGKADVVLVDSLAEVQRRLPELVGPGDVVLFENDLPDQYEG
jgi:UDP-N-acetylmuramoyl-tripeptide--D-alanyl-D-alanine ligase